MKIVIKEKTISLNLFLGEIVLDLDSKESELSINLSTNQAKEIALILFNLANEKERREEQRQIMPFGSLSVLLNDDKQKEWISENFNFEDIIKRYKSKNNGRLYTEKEVKNLCPKK